MRFLFSYLAFPSQYFMTNTMRFSVLLILLFSFSYSFAQNSLLEITLNGKVNEIEAIASGVYCLENNDSLTFSYKKAIEGGDYVFQGVFVYGQLNLGNPERLFSIPAISAPFTIALRDLVPEKRIPPYDKGGTRIFIAISRVLKVNGKRAEEIISIPKEESLSLVVYTGCE